MRWGVREESENDHMSTELCLKELKSCQKLSTGPNFVVGTTHVSSLTMEDACIKRSFHSIQFFH